MAALIVTGIAVIAFGVYFVAAAMIAAARKRDDRSARDPYKRDLK